ncbi:MAG: FmdB family zinc ribbon protein [Actinomycetota bacterium]
MPLHEYLCQDCQSRFEAITAAARADEVTCPMCRSVQTRRLISVIAGVGGRSSSGAADMGYASAPSGGCCGGAGGCACGR